MCNVQANSAVNSNFGSIDFDQAKPRIALMNIQTSIEQKLKALEPAHLEVVNESHMHNVPEGSESHFRITIVSDQFVNKMLVARHRLVNQLLAEELAGGIHALSLHTRTTDEWFSSSKQAPESPPCLGGSTKEKTTP